MSESKNPIEYCSCTFQSGNIVYTHEHFQIHVDCGKQMDFGNLKLWDNPITITEKYYFALIHVAEMAEAVIDNPADDEAVRDCLRIALDDLNKIKRSYLK